jgi:single-strand DNA-binding protein
MSGKSLNRVLLIGNVTRDPELRYTPQGNAVATFGLATNRSWKTDTGEIREEAEFHRLVSWNKLAELCAQLCTKGKKIYVEGRLQTRTFTGSDNAQHTITEIVIDDMILLGSPTGATPPATTEPAKPVTPVTPPADDVKPKKAKKETKEEKAEETKPEEPKKTEEVKEDVNLDEIPF